MPRKRTESVSKRKKIKEERTRRKRQQRLTTLLVIIGAAFIFVSLMVYPTLQRALQPVGEFVPITPNPRPNADFNAAGDPNAPVKIINFSDFQCPYCKRFSDQTEPLITQDYIATGKVYYRFVPFGPGGIYIGSESEDAAMASFCAGEQGKFWEYHDILFANHTGENVGDYVEKRLMAFAESIGLDMQQFTSCFNSDKYEEKLQEGINEGIEAEVNGTPAFLINGKLIIGAVPYEDFRAEIETALLVADTQ